MKTPIDFFSSHKWRPMILSFVGLLVGAMVVSLIWTVVAIRTTQVSNTIIGKDTNHAAETSEELLVLVRDCVETTGDCFRQNQINTKEVVGSLNSAALLAASFSAACADREGVQGVEEIYQCTKRLIREANKEGKR